jgi:transcriptional regulator with XRE-family HTH domain
VVAPTTIPRDQLREALRRRGCSQTQLARAAGLSTATISKLLSGNGVVSVAVFERVVNALSAMPLRSEDLLAQLRELAGARSTSELAQKNGRPMELTGT